MYLTDARKRGLGVLLYCLAATALFFRGPLFFPHRFHIPHDLTVQHYPWAEFIARSLRETGRLPWWNPYSFMGEPFAGNLQAAMFYPPKMLAILLANLLIQHVSLRVMELLLVAHVALAGAGCYVLLRRLGARRAASLAGATLYELGPALVSQAQHLGYVSASGWLPWLLVALHRLEERRDGHSAALAGTVLALMILPGHPPGYQPALIFGPLLYGFWVWQREPASPWGRYARPAVLLAGAFALGALLATVAWLPAYQVSRHSVASLWAAISVRGLRPEAATSFLWPNLFNQLRGDYWLSTDNPVFMHVYVGALPLFIVGGALGWLGRLRSGVAFLAAAGFALLWMFGDTFFVSLLIYGLAPRFMGGGFHAQYVLVYFSLFFAVLAGLAIDGWERGERNRLFRPKLCGRTAALAAGMGVLVCAAGLVAPANSPLITRAVTSGASLLLVALSLGLGWLVFRGHEAAEPAARRRFVGVLCALLLFDLVTIGSNAEINTGRGNGEASPFEVAFLQERLAAEPLYRMDSSEVGYIWRGRLLLWRIPSINGINPLMLRDTVVYRQPFSRLTDRQFDLEVPDSPLLDLAGVRYIVTPRESVEGARLVKKGSENVFENERAMPRYFLVGDAVIARDVGDAARMIHVREADAARVAVVSEKDAALFRGLAGPAPSAELGTVQLLTYTPNEVRLRAETSRASILIATETFWPDWHATVDGRPAPLVRADGIFRAIPLPAGTHEVRMYIVPRMLYFGAGLSLAGLLLTGALLISPAARRREPSAVRGDVGTTSG